MKFKGGKMNENNFIGKNIKSLREKFKFSQEELANKLNVSSQAVSKWETEESMPTIDTLLRLSKIFYTAVDDLITGQNSTENFTENESAINIELKSIYYAYHRNENVGTKMNDLVAKILPLYNYEKDYYWIYSARIILKGTIYGILEDNDIDENKVNIKKIKEILQFSNLDLQDKRNQILSYFDNKSDKTKEYLSSYLCNAQSTANSIMGLIVTYINILSL